MLKNYIEVVVRRHIGKADEDKAEDSYKEKLKDNC